MKTMIRVTILALTLALLAGGEAWGQARFDGSSGTSWGTAANWTPEAVPTIGSNVVIGTTNAAVGASGSPMTATITSGDASEAASLTLGEHSGNSGTLNMDGGTLTLPAAGLT